MKNILHIARLLSLDVVLGALASAYMFEVYLEIEMPNIFWPALALSVWVIYTADHILDAYRLEDQAHTHRHLFHHRYFKEISAVLGVSLFICVAVLPFYVPAYMLYFAIGMGGLTLLHFFLVKWIGDRTSLFFLKELGVGLIYSLGVVGPLLLAKYPDWIWMDFLMGTLFFLLAMINLFTFSMYELETDEQDGHTSFVRAIGKEKTKTLLQILSSVLVLGIIISMTFPIRDFTFQVSLIYLLMLAILLWVFMDEKRFRTNHAYRAWADGVFLFPLLIFFFERT